MKYQGKTVFITGTARGIGQGLAVAFAKEGCQIIGCDLGPQHETAALVGAKYRGFTADISTPEGAKTAVDNAANIGFDILINNAGIATSGLFENADFNRWKATIDVNLIGLMAVTHAALPHLRTRPAAHIVNLSSIAGCTGSPGMAAYCASKAGVTHLTRSVALDCAARDVPVRANTVHPGAIRTPMYERYLNAGGATPDEIEVAMASAHPVGRVGEPEEVAKAILFLSSDESSFTSGADLTVDGASTIRE